MKLSVRKIRLDRDGYARRGQGARQHYYGAGEALWKVRDAATGGDVVDVELRAPSAREARRLVLEAGPHGVWRIDAGARWRTRSADEDDR